MYPLSLSTAERLLYERGLCDVHSMRVRVRVLDMDQNFLGESTSRVLSGQVDFDANADVTRSCNLTILDSDHMLNLDSSSVFGGSLFLDRMVQIWYGVYSRHLPKWVDVPIFTGPITEMSRDGDVVNLTGKGKESLLMDPASTHRTWRAGSYKTTVLRELLGMFGEAYMDIPHQTTKTTKNLTVAPSTIPWDYIQSVARSWGSGRIVYDGAGVARFIGPDNRSRWSFKTGDGGTILSKPKLQYDVSKAKNLVVVLGATPSKGGKQISGLAHAPQTHPLSSSNLGRNGVRRYLREDISDSSITTAAAAVKLAEETLQDRLAGGTQLDFTAIPVPHLEPYDYVTVNSGTWSTSSTMTAFTLPLTADGVMTVGRKHAGARYIRNRPTTRKGPRR